MFLTVSAGKLEKWYNMMRTRYGRFESHKSGDGRKVLTEREEWIKRSFAFLKQHIRRVPSRQACAVSICPQILTSIQCEIKHCYLYATTVVTS